MFHVYNKCQGLAPKHYVICLYIMIKQYTQKLVFRKHVNECLCGNILSNTMSWYFHQSENENTPFVY